MRDWLKTRLKTQSVHGLKDSSSKAITSFPKLIRKLNTKLL
jgi:hypothetical protein